MNYGRRMPASSGWCGKVWYVASVHNIRLRIRTPWRTSSIVISLRGRCWMILARRDAERMDAFLARTSRFAGRCIGLTTVVFLRGLVPPHFPSGPLISLLSTTSIRSAQNSKAVSGPAMSWAWLDLKQRHRSRRCDGTQMNALNTRLSLSPLIVQVTPDPA